MKQTAKLIGRVAVDSGVLRIGDPCYQVAYDEETGAKNVLEHILPIEGIPASEALDFSTTWGDGIYDIIGVYENERLIQIIIDLDFL